MSATAVASRSRPVGSRLEVVPSSNGFGADIVGFDFELLDERQVAEMRAAWLDHGVVRFRGYRFSDEQQVRLTGMLGDFVKHPRQLKGEEGAHPDHEEILVIGNAKVDGKSSGTMGNSEAQWHTDTWFYERPPAAALLHAIELPPEGGDTYFADMYGIYEQLPSALRKILEGRLIQSTTIFDGAGRVRTGQTAPDTDDIRLWAHMRHPIVRTHGESGRNCLYVGIDSPSSWIVGLPLDESAAILSEIFDFVRMPDFQFKQVWEDGDMIMWDNRCTMHRRDGWDGQYTRVMHRTTTLGERPFYRY
ncbi:TauD/TfdA dioxygenase family protein [Sphingobium chlorophenolicum]|uniref:Taurine dioxygenase n=1 Tax=Sphingobium chlorophenolicum TaxID=46429 RepID=A0A081RF17_SPHCR|nr:TauD/TfdA family dioxygenase [Sphingobium chlorophenolicum]KEQ53790.1 Taurine dioxygenase [Sphingobium chlorophenolicum]